MKRIRWEVRYRKSDGAWLVYAGKEWLFLFPLKVLAVRRAAEQCRWNWANGGELSELTIKRRDGTIQDKRTYGADPRRTPG